MCSRKRHPVQLDAIRSHQSLIMWNQWKTARRITEQIFVLLICQIISSSYTKCELKRKQCEMPPLLPPPPYTQTIFSHTFALFCIKCPVALGLSARSHPARGVGESIQSFNKFTFCTNVILSGDLCSFCAFYSFFCSSSSLKRRLTGGSKSSATAGTIEALSVVGDFCCCVCVFFSFIRINFICIIQIVCKSV